MKKIILIAIFTALTAMSYVGLYYGIPMYATNKVRIFLETHNIDYRRLRVDYGLTEFRMVLTGLKLHDDDFQTLEKASVLISLLPYILNDEIKAIRLEKLSFTVSHQDFGDSSDDLFWNKELFRGFLQQSNVSQIKCMRCDVSYLNQDWGDFVLSFPELQLGRTEEGWGFSGPVKSVHRQLSVEGILEGSINERFQGFANIQIDSFEADFDGFKFNRGQGQMDLKSNGALFIDGAFQIGGARLLGTPWQNVNLAMQGQYNDFQALLSGRALGVEGVELTYEYRQNDVNLAQSGILYAQNGESVLTYIKGLGIDLEQNQAAAMKEIEGLEIAFKPSDEAINTLEYVFRDPKGQTVKSSVALQVAD